MPPRNGGRRRRDAIGREPGDRRGFHRFERRDVQRRPLVEHSRASPEDAGIGCDDADHHAQPRRDGRAAEGTVAVDAEAGVEQDPGTRAPPVLREHRHIGSTRPLRRCPAEVLSPADRAVQAPDNHRTAVTGAGVGRPQHVQAQLDEVLSDARRSRQRQRFGPLVGVCAAVLLVEVAAAVALHRQLHLARVVRRDRAVVPARAEERGQQRRGRERGGFREGQVVTRRSEVGADLVRVERVHRRALQPAREERHHRGQRMTGRGMDIHAGEGVEAVGALLVVRVRQARNPGMRQSILERL